MNISDKMDAKEIAATVMVMNSHNETMNAFGVVIEFYQKMAEVAIDNKIEGTRECIELSNRLISMQKELVEQQKILLANVNKSLAELETPNE